ncbi:tetratricopeptide repeat-containing glycosyltransferase family 2 protein [Salirhabdus sp. Marseille-P4669]|uniref:tetratricopeptide repeat-containing glycosyltransferase family 2 protein n=1 Tax=Salirhabdus sp. Marseille-P4669 TaxID=2042310 RepID=UPI000C7A04B5|nr:glycosyltransferase [Salirhabdus sp. Marseille-P4669]
MNPFISLCMIVKNEENVIDRCLKSVSHLVDEIIVVDTGSTDNTKEIVSKYTNNLYDYTWKDDFSDARNYAASKAKADWILVLDADEYVEEENFRSFIEQLKADGNQYDTYYAKIINFTGSIGESLVQNYHDRIYRNNGEIIYYRSIHEQFKNINDTPIRNKKSNLIVFHSGYLNKTMDEKNKIERNHELIDKEMEKGSNQGFDFFNFGNEYYSLGEIEKALDAYLEAYKRKIGLEYSWVPTTLVQIILCLVHLKRYNDALNVIRDAEQIYETAPEFPYLKGEVYFLRGQFEDAKQVFNHIVSSKERYTNVVLRPDLKDLLPHSRLGEISLYKEDFNNAIYHYTSVLNINKYEESSIKKVIYILNKFHSPGEISTFLIENNLLNNKNIKSYVIASFEAGNAKLAIRLLNGYEKEHQILYKVSLLKNITIHRNGNIEEIRELLNPNVLSNLLESKFVNFIDLLILREYIEIDKSLELVLKEFEKNNIYQNLINLTDGKASVENLDENLILYSLQILLTYKNYALCDVFLDEIEKVDKSILVKVSRLLYESGFKAEALQLYELCDWNSYVQRDFINIINGLIKTNNLTSAVEFSKAAMFTFEDDFRFYEYILKYTRDVNIFNSTINEAYKIFQDSFYLETLNIRGTGL